MLGLLAPASAFISRVPMVVRTAAASTRKAHVIKVRKDRPTGFDMPASACLHTHPPTIPLVPSMSAHTRRRPPRAARRPSCSPGRAPSTSAWRPRCVVICWDHWDSEASGSVDQKASSNHLPPLIPSHPIPCRWRRRCRRPRRCSTRPARFLATTCWTAPSTGPRTCSTPRYVP